MVVFSALYIAGAVNPMENDPARYTHFGQSYVYGGLSAFGAAAVLPGVSLAFHKFGCV